LSARRQGSVSNPQESRVVGLQAGRFPFLPSIDEVSWPLVAATPREVKFGAAAVGYSDGNETAKRRQPARG